MQLGMYDLALLLVGGGGGVILLLKVVEWIFSAGTQSDRIERHDEVIESLQEEMVSEGELNSRMQSLSSSINEIKGDVKGIRGDVDANTEDIQKIQKSISSIETNIDWLTKNGTGTGTESGKEGGS